MKIEKDGDIQEFINYNLRMYHRNLYRISIFLLAVAYPLAGFAEQADKKCGAFHNEPQKSSVIIIDEGQPASFTAPEEPAVDVQLSFPTAFLSDHRADSAEISRQDGESFKMHVRDGSPVTKEALKSKASSRSVGPIVDFLVSDQFEIKRIIAVSVRSEMPGDQEISWDPIEISVAETIIPGLFKLANPRDDFYSSLSEKYVSKKSGEFDILIECSRPKIVPHPHCTMKFDRANLNINATLPLSALSEWATAREQIESFLDCSHTRDIPVRMDGDLTWR